MAGKDDASSELKKKSATPNITVLEQDSKNVAEDDFLVKIHNNQIPNSKNKTKTLCILPKNKPIPRQKLFVVAKINIVCYNIKVIEFTEGGNLWILEA